MILDQAGNNLQKERADRACKQLGLAEEQYRDTFEQIASAWERQLGTADYLDVFITPVILKLCKEPSDFLRASQIVLQAMKEVWGDGSNGFLKVLVQAIEDGKVTSLSGLQVLCDQLIALNCDFKRSKDGLDIFKRTGEQFRRFFAEINPQL